MSIKQLLLAIVALQLGFGCSNGGSHSLRDVGGDLHGDLRGELRSDLCVDVGPDHRPDQQGDLHRDHRADGGQDVVSHPDARDTVDLPDVEDLAMDLEPGTCDPNWEKVPSELVQTTEEMTHYTRPFFTMCKDGRFFWDDWRFYYDGIMPNEVDAKAKEVKCPSGECKWGICKEDAEFIENQIPVGTPLVDGVIRFDNKACIPCNPNNKVFYYNEFQVEPGSFGPCEGSYSCCEEPEILDGPCHGTAWYWVLLVGVPEQDPETWIAVEGLEQDYVDGDPGCLDTAEWNCEPFKNGRCVPDTATMVTSRWVASNSFVLSGEHMAIDEMRLTMGSDSRIPQLRAIPPKPCQVGDERTEITSTYFTCSGMATIKLTDGRWFKFVWMHQYDRDKCELPCWFATESTYLEHPVPVKIAVWEIPPEPKW